jgi:osmoprotectant transport system ATP-binding protein
VITFDHVTKRFPDGTTAVDDLSLEIPTGAITVFVGPSGCGKTTSLRMINRMIEPTEGRVLLDGEDVRGIKAAALRRRIGYVIQQAGLFPHRTVVDNIATVPLLLGQSRREARTRARELMETVGLEPTLATRYPYQLSGGQQQRVGVARALAADPPVMLMDEPFSAVDPVVRGNLQDEFLRLQQRLGKTIVFVTHDIDEAIKLGDRIALLRVGGRLAQYDSPRELLAAPGDGFVTDFLGADRGIRRLGFFGSDGITLREDGLVTTGLGQRQARAAAERAALSWLLVVDDERRALGWYDARADAKQDLTVDQATLAPVGHTFSVAVDSLRTALDSAVLSPAGHAVATDADGQVLGLASQATIAEAIRRAAAQDGAAVPLVGDPIARNDPGDGPAGATLPRVDQNTDDAR